MPLPWELLTSIREALITERNGVALQLLGLAVIVITTHTHGNPETIITLPPAAAGGGFLLMVLGGNIEASADEEYPGLFRRDD